MHAEMDAINKVNALLPDEDKSTAYSRQGRYTRIWFCLMHAETCQHAGNLLAAVSAQQDWLTESLQGCGQRLELKGWVLTVQVPIVCDLRAVHHVRRSPQPAALPGGKLIRTLQLPLLPEMLCVKPDPTSPPRTAVLCTSCCGPCFCGPSVLLLLQRRRATEKQQQ